MLRLHDVSRQRWLDAFFFADAMQMSFEKSLGEVLRDTRIRSGLSHYAFAEVISASHLRQVEKGLVTVKIGTLVALCDAMGLLASQILLVAEARHAGLAIEGLLVASGKQCRALLAEGFFEPLSSKEAARGLRGQKADATREETARLQMEGLSKAEIARRLGVTVRTVERYWVRPEEDAD